MKVLESELSFEGIMLETMKKCLSLVSQKGIGSHCFFVSFIKKHPEVSIPKMLMRPEVSDAHDNEITIVLQHQFNNLSVTDKAFEVLLSFNGIAERIFIPFDAITAFAEPNLSLSLYFEHHKRDYDGIILKVIKDQKHNQKDSDSIQHEKVIKGKKKNPKKKTNMLKFEDL